MDSSRDSSVWRSLAVTFGGGLALGAVGMKLTESVLRPAESALRPDSNPATDRLAAFERRLERFEQAPAASRPQGAPVPMDQKVLEAVIGAVDARLHEHSGQMDRRLADLEARLAVEVQAHQIERQSSGANEKHISEIQRQFLQELDTLRSALKQDFRQVTDRLSQAVAGQSAIHTEIESLHQQNERLVDAAEQRFTDMRFEYRQSAAELRDSLSRAIAGEKASREQTFTEIRAALDQSVETRAITAAAAAAAQFDERLAPLRAEVRRKEQELMELRRRLTESEGTVLDVISSIGQVCRDAAERIQRRPPALPADVPPPEPAVTPAAVEAVPPAAPAAAQPILAGAEAPAPAVVTLPAPQPVADPSLARAIPDFLHESDRNTWRIPLVSSVLVALTTTGLFLLHYL